MTTCRASEWTPRADLNAHELRAWHRLAAAVDGRVETIASDVLAFELLARTVALAERARMVGDPAAREVAEAAREIGAQFFLDLSSPETAEA